MFASRPCRLTLAVTCRQIWGRPHNAGALEQAENGPKQPPDEGSFPLETEYHLGLTEIFAEIIYDLIGLRTLAETFLPFEVSRRQHVDYLMIRV